VFGGKLGLSIFAGIPHEIVAVESEPGLNSIDILLPSSLIVYGESLNGEYMLIYYTLNY
jgi:hypothetical protein